MNKPIPRLLPYLLRRFASDPALGVRVSILTKLPFVVHHHPDLGWKLVNDALGEAQGGLDDLWSEVEPVLYYQYRDSFDLVGPLLERIGREAPDVAGETYGRILTLCWLAGHSATGGRPLLALATTDSIRTGIAQVLCANLGEKPSAEACRTTLLAMLQKAESSAAAATALGRKLGGADSDAAVDADLVLAYLDALQRLRRPRDTWGLCAWLERRCRWDPLLALVLCEKLVALRGEEEGMRLHSGMVTVLLEILREADEANDPQLIARAVKLQDEFLRLGVVGVDELLNN